jgi:hypothetical protein
MDEKKKKKKAPRDTNWRSFSVDVFVSSSWQHDPTKGKGENKRLKDAERKQRYALERRIITSLELYRYVCRQIFCVEVLADCAAAKVGFRKLALNYSDTLVTKLQLTEDQKKSVKTILDQNKKALEEKFKAGAQSPVELLANVSRSAEDELKAVLTSEQMDIWRTEENTYSYVIPDRPEAKKILEDLFEIREKAALFYEMRSYILRVLAPNWKSATWDSARLVTERTYKGVDPEFGVTRSWAILQGVRNLGRMASVPLVINHRCFKVDKHSITFGWDHDIGEVEFKVMHLDGARWALWNSFATGKLEVKEVQLNTVKTEDGPKLVLRIAYKKESKVFEKIAERSIEVNFDDTGIMVYMRDGKEVPAAGLPLDDVRKVFLSYAAALASIDELKIQDEKLLALVRACGSFGECRRGEGVPQTAKAYQRRRNKLAQLRDKRVKDWNHRWSLKILSTAEAWKCGKIVVFGPPEKVCGRPWQWFNFKFNLDYKAQERGITVQYLEPPELELNLEV